MFQISLYLSRAKGHLPEQCGYSERGTLLYLGSLEEAGRQEHRKDGGVV